MLTRRDFTGGGPAKYSSMGRSRVWSSKDDRFYVIATDYSWTGQRGTQRYSEWTVYRKVEGASSVLLACSKSWRTSAAAKALPTVDGLDSCIAFLNGLDAA